MKQSKWTMRVTMLVLFLAVLAYLVASGVRSFMNPFSTVLAYSYTLDDKAEMTGLLVRQEERLTQTGGAIVDVLPGEGEKVAAGAVVAYLYRDEAALASRREAKALELEREQLLRSLERSDVGWDSAKLDQSVVDAMLKLKSSAASGDLTRLEDQAMSLKSMVLRRSYTGGAADIQAAVAEIDARLAALRLASEQDTTPIYTYRAGAFASQADGYEELLTPERLEGLTPSGLEALEAAQPAPAEGAVGKLVTGSRWYFAANLPDADAQRLIEGWKVNVRFSRDWSGQVVMRVEHISEAENGRRAVVFSTDRSLADTILLRRQTVELIFDSTTGVRVPKKAVRSVALEEKDANGAPVTRQATGVYVVAGAQAEFKEARIVANDGDFYLLQPVNPDSAAALRAGDEIIVSAVDLYEGKVVR